MPVRAQTAVPGGTEPGHQGHVRQRLHVVDERGTATHATGSDRGGPEKGGHRVHVPIHRVDHRRLLACEERGRGDGHLDRHGVHAGAPSLADGCPYGRGDGLRHVGHDPYGIERAGHCSGTVEHQMWRGGQQQGVLATRRLPLCAVRHHHRPAQSVPGDVVPLRGDREPSTAVPDHARPLRLRHQGRGGAADVDRPPALQVRGEPVRDRAGACQQAREHGGRGGPAERRGDAHRSTRRPARGSGTVPWMVPTGSPEPARADPFASRQRTAASTAAEQAP